MDISNKMEEVERSLRKLTMDELETVALSADCDVNVEYANGIEQETEDNAARGGR